MVLESGYTTVYFYLPLLTHNENQGYKATLKLRKRHYRRTIRYLFRITLIPLMFWETAVFQQHLFPFSNVRDRRIFGDRSTVASHFDLSYWH